MAGGIDIEYVDPKWFAGGLGGRALSTVVVFLFTARAVLFVLPAQGNRCELSLSFKLTFLKCKRKLKTKSGLGFTESLLFDFFQD